MPGRPGFPGGPGSPGSPISPFCPVDPSKRENCVGGTSQLWKPSVAGGVTGLYEGLGVLWPTGDLVVKDCFVGLMTCLVTGLELLEVVVLEMVAFEGLTLGIVGLEGETLTEFTFGLDGVAFEGVTLGLGVVFLVVVGCGFFRMVPWSDKVASGFILEGLVLVVAGMAFFFLSSVIFLEVLLEVGFEGVGLVGF